ncbi:hypothetical protein L2E82_18421 [Cichorium intybus]|uniref:Uncharacterized protein n=1 Tax=Cichorium intybus TaxID=13427 RepID=A0ACB9FAJ4_CICIN|nr:hypothetical protein L2E82_18421 [Cichorium intybus]
MNWTYRFRNDFRRRAASSSPSPCQKFAESSTNILRCRSPLQILLFPPDSHSFKQYVPLPNPSNIALFSFYLDSSAAASFFFDDGLENKINEKEI